MYWFSIDVSRKFTIGGKSSSAIANGAVDETRNVRSIIGTGIYLGDCSIVTICGEPLLLFDDELTGSKNKFQDKYLRN